MLNYTLNIDLTSDQLKLIALAGQSITILKAPPGSGPQVSWVSFTPFAKNTVTWEESYALYASTTQLQAGAVITKMIDTDASEGEVLPLEASGTFGTATPGSAGSFGVANEYSNESDLIFGLAQAVQVNGKASPNHPIGAQVVLYNQTAEFTPYETIRVFLSASTVTSQLVTHVAGEAISLKYGGDVPSYTITYDSDAGKFVVLA